MAFQVGSAFLDACVLAVLTRQDAYGYALTQRMREVVDISESTLYPVLRRLQKSEYLSTYDKPYQGRNRRYYRITDEGIKKYEEYRTEWIWHKTKVDELMFGSPATAENSHLQTESGLAPGQKTEKVQPGQKTGETPQTEQEIGQSQQLGQDAEQTQQPAGEVDLEKNLEADQTNGGGNVAEDHKVQNEVSLRKEQDEKNEIGGGTEHE